MKATLIVIESEADHALAKALVGKLMGSRVASDRARMVAQARLIEAYERARWPLPVPTLPDLLTYLMAQHGLTRRDLVPLLGTPSRVSEVLSGKRDLSMSMVRRLRARYNAASKNPTRTTRFPTGTCANGDRSGLGEGLRTGRRPPSLAILRSSLRDILSNFRATLSGNSPPSRAARRASRITSWAYASPPRGEFGDGIGESTRSPA